jgi:hypothetical protein
MVTLYVLYKGTQPALIKGSPWTSVSSVVPLFFEFADVESAKKAEEAANPDQKYSIKEVRLPAR